MQGIFTSLITPFYQGAIDDVSLKKLLAHQCDSGIHGLVILDTAGENATLEDEERQILITSVLQATQPHKIPLWVGIESNCTACAFKRMQAAEASGADGFLIVTPFYNCPTQTGLFLHFDALANATQKPICLYASPLRCGVELMPETIARLRQQHPNMIAIKEGGGSCNRVARLIKDNSDTFSVLSSDDALALPFFALGAKGSISVAANWIAREMVQLFQYAAANDFESAAVINRRYYPFFRALTLESHPTVIKYILYRMGYIRSPEVRRPLAPLAPETAKMIDQILSDLHAIE